MLRILHVVSGLKVGGAEMMLHRLIVASAGEAYDHWVVSLGVSGGMKKRFEDSGIHLISLDFKSAPFFAFIELIKVIRSSNADIVQTWLYHADFLGGLAARIAGIKNIIWGIRTTDIHGGRFGTATIVRKVCAWLSKCVPRLIVCAAEASRKAHVAFGYDARRMLVIPNGFDLSRFVPNPKERLALRHQCGFDEHLVVVGFLGRFHADKDQASFIRAAGIVASAHPNVRFLMVGRDLVTGNVQLQSWVNATGYAERFMLFGERADVPACLTAMDVFCLSSRTEGFPNVVGEAMAMGLPCVVTDVGDAAMLVADTGVVVPKEDAAALAGGIERLLEMSVPQREQLGQRGKARIHSDFSMEKVRVRFETLYEQMTRKESN